MKIQEIFIKEESAIIREAIDTLPVEGCLKKYFSYVDANGDTDFESKFINKLNDRFKDFILKLRRRTIENKSLEEMQDLYLDALWYGLWCYDGADSYEIREDLENYFTDKDLHEEIKKELSEALKELLEELHATKAQEEIKTLTVLLKSKKDNIARYQEQKEQEELAIKELEERIEKIKEEGNYAG